MVTPKLIGRSKELQIAKDRFNNISNHSTLLLVYGDSGCGKTFFTKKFAREVIGEQDMYACYVNADADEMTSSSIFEIMTYFSWNEYKSNNEDILSIPAKTSFSDFIKKRKINSNTRNSIISALNNSLSLIPVYGDVAKCLIPPKNNDFETSQQSIENLYCLYLKKIALKRKVILVIDNYQFINEKFRIRIEAHLGEIRKNLCLVIIERTIGGRRKIRNPICFEANQTHILLSQFDTELTKEYLREVFTKCSKELSDHFYRITKGNPKELELAVINYQQGFIGDKNFTLKTLVETVHMLPEIEKYIVVVSSFFPSGMKLNYIADIIRRNLFIETEDEIVENINALKMLGYIIVNSSSGDLVKPAHEKIITCIKTLLNDDEYIDIYNNLLLSIEEIIASNVAMNRNELYLLNCLIGLFTTKQLKEKINYVIMAITNNYQQCLYNHVVLLYPDIKEVLTVLPDDCINKILDSFQKTSNFFEGLEMIALLKNISDLSFTYNLYYAKFLTQTYQFKEAIDVLQRMEDTDAVILYKMNVFQHLGDDDEVKRLLSMILNRGENANSFSDAYYMILRNTAHYFPYQEALLNLTQVKEYCKRRGFIFGEATADNNIGVVYLWVGDLAKAHRVLLRANTIFENINSNELFETQINLGVLSFLEHDYEAATKYMENADIVVPKLLWMDSLIIHMNKTICQLAEGKITVAIAYDELYEAYLKTKICQDPWVRSQVAYNISIIAKLLDKVSPETPDKKFEIGLKSKKYTRFDVLALLNINGKPVEMSLSLSPNWRY